MDRMDGNTGFRSRQGSGFRLRPSLPYGARGRSLVPAVPSHNPFPSGVSAAGDPPPAVPGSGGASILVVEDNPVNQKVFRTILEHLGYGCDLVANGQEALEAMAARHYDLVFMDCQMPVMDGYEAVRRARTGPLAHKGAIIAMTAHALDGAREKCIQAGMDDYLAKPVALDTLVRLMEKWLRPRQAG